MTTTEGLRPAYLAGTHTGLPIPSRPTFDRVDDERRHRKQRLAAALRIFGRYGFGEGISGHISVRDPEHPDRFWVNPFGVSFRLVTVGDLICVDDTGRVVEGRHAVNPSAFVIHSRIHALNPGAEAAAHAHTTHSRALGTLGRLLEPMDQESAAFYQDQVLYTDYQGPSVTVEQGADIAERLGDKRAILLTYHGLITVGGSIEEAVHWFITYDSCAQVQLLVAAAGVGKVMSHEQAVAAKDGFGDAQLSRFSFQLLYDEIVRDEPDLLDEGAGRH
ncbi:class II aldolase/adducin family protein [Micromonospora mirobrigensis]|uniref:Ribulose-5-phosphate 4-epimerase/Fuculose-1-phosphate aldolase n=1 Tax=Micromonospora mirobrigensis TaxID=262898 RepID=A0A1C4WYV0_9ACTN|nr:class II aldolase/adducin family protein [Micromonospora mirobrigensis]SCF01396.1 Ribulose-5-phosphate 4-epimerase/Fuculose-1-phosphate aldolase [Micromonospora mirobrigensis]